MDSMDNWRERIAALEQQMNVMGAHTRTVERRWGGWHGIAWGVGLLALVSLAPRTQAADFSCAAGDVTCLINAINTANVNGDTNTITLEAGTYTLTAVDNLTEGSPNERNGLPSITSTLTVRGAGADTTILERAATAPAFRLLHIAASGTLALEGLTLQGGRCVGSNEGLCFGGAGLRNLGTVTLSHSVVRRNVSDEFNGGADAGLQNLGMATLTHCAFINNTNGNTLGGGLDNEGTLTIHRCTFTNNQAPEASGGGIANRGTLLLTASALTGNAASMGGGIANSGILVVLNSTIARGGSGLSNGGTATVLNSTIAENAGGIGNARGTVVLLNTLLAGNTGRTGTLDCAGPITSLGHNLIGDPTGCTLPLQPTDLTGDPDLDAFTDDGTPGNAHFPLLPTSQAIDHGNTAACPRTDQLGQRRIGRCDIGAIRFLDNADVQQEDDTTAATQATK
jgi:hypothetical protein